MLKYSKRIYCHTDETYNWIYQNKFYCDSDECSSNLTQQDLRFYVWTPTATTLVTSKFSYQNKVEPVTCVGEKIIFIIYIENEKYYLIIIFLFNVIQTFKFSSRGSMVLSF